MLLKSHRPLLLAAALILTVPATFATAQAAPPHYDNHRHAESLHHRQQASCGHIHSAHARHSCEARVSREWQHNRHH
jgi:hypothetical protein